MAHGFAVGDHLEWNSEAGRVRGTIRQIVTAPMQFKGYAEHAAEAEPLMKEKRMPLEHTRPERDARFAADRLHVLALESVASELRQEPSYQKNGRNGTTLVKTPLLRQVLEVLRAGAALDEHTAPGPITVQLLHGEVRFEAGTESVQLQPGQLLSLPSERPHRVEAVKDSTFLLTIEMAERNSGVVFGQNFSEKR